MNSYGGNKEYLKVYICVDNINTYLPAIFYNCKLWLKLGLC